MRKAVLLLCFAYTALTTASQLGTLDPNFGSGGIVRSNLFIGRGPAIARKTFVQPDSTLLVVMQEDNQVITKRFFKDGSFDPEYNQYEYSLTLAYGDAAQDNLGRIVIAGTKDKDFVIGYLYQEEPQYIRMGFPDSSIATSIVVQRDGKIVLAGYTFINGLAHLAVARCFADGRLDSSFSGDGRQVSSNGNNGAFATCMALQPDGKILVGGYAGGYLAHRDFSLVRYNTNGSRDLSFSNDGKKLTTVGEYDDFANAIAVQGDGKILLTGRTQLKAASNLFAIATVRYLSNGSIDSSFSDDGITEMAIDNNAEGVAILVQDDAKIVVAATNSDFLLLRYNSNGSLDKSIGSGGIRSTDFSNGTDHVSSALLLNGKVLLTGWTDLGRGTLRQVALASYKADLEPDVSFSNDGKVSRYVSTSTTGLACSIVQPDGKLVVGGYGADYDYTEYTMLVLARYNQDGSLDRSFGREGKVNTELEFFGTGASLLALQGDGNIVVGSTNYNLDNGTSDIVLVRYNTHGAIDHTFGNNGITYIDFSDEMGGESDDDIKAIAIQANGKIVVVGGAFLDAEESPTIKSVMARCNAEGSLDTGFDGDGKQVLQFPDVVNTVAIQQDNKIIVAGNTFSHRTGQPVFAVARYDEDGSFDQSFSNDGKLTTEFDTPGAAALASTVIVQSNNKIVAAGISSGKFAMARYYSSGRLDRSFNDTGKQTTDFGDAYAHYTISLQPESKILAIGTTGTRIALAQYNEEGTLDSMFATNGRHIIDVANVQDQINGIALSENRLYTIGYNQDYVGAGVIAAFQLRLKPLITKIVKMTDCRKERTNLIINAFPNPTIQYFTIQISSSNEVPISILIIDAAGRIVEDFNRRSINSSIQFGADYPPGVYFAELIQGKRKSTVKLVKSTH